MKEAWARLGERAPIRVVRAATGVEDWREIDENYGAGAFRLRLWNWQRERRFVVIRERVREEKPSRGRKLFEVPGYTFRVLVTNRWDRPEEVWRDYNSRRAWDGGRCSR